MKMKNRQHLLIGAALLFTACTIQAQVKPQVRDFAQQNFDAAAASLGPAYLGHNCTSVAKSLTAINSAKDEFESSAAYVERMANIPALTLYGKVSTDGLLAFVVEAKDAKYDADAQMMRLPLKLIQTVKLRPPSNTTISAMWVDVVLKSEKKFKASNALGATVDAKLSEFETCSVAFANMDATPGYQYGRPDIDQANIAMSSDQARAAKPNLAIAYVGKAVAPFLAESFTGRAPTIDLPYGSMFKGPAVVLRFEQVVVFDRKSGDVLYRSTGR